MPSAVADFPDRAPPSTSTRRPARAVPGEAGKGAVPARGVVAPPGGAVTWLAGSVPPFAPGGGVPEDGGVPADGGVPGDGGVPADGAAPGDDGEPGARRSRAASWATSPMTTTAGLVTPAASTLPARSRSGA